VYPLPKLIQSTDRSIYKSTKSHYFPYTTTFTIYINYIKMVNCCFISKTGRVCRRPVSKGKWCDTHIPKHRWGDDTIESTKMVFMEPSQLHINTIGINVDVMKKKIQNTDKMISYAKHTKPRPIYNTCYNYKPTDKITHTIYPRDAIPTLKELVALAKKGMLLPHTFNSVQLRYIKSKYLKFAMRIQSRYINHMGKLQWIKETKRQGKWRH
jgi:hypothetical protein